MEKTVPFMLYGSTNVRGGIVAVKHNERKVKDSMVTLHNIIGNGNEVVGREDCFFFQRKIG